MQPAAPVFLICTTARSGSNLLSDYLKNTGHVGTVAEFFNPRVVRTGWLGAKFPADNEICMPAYIDFLMQSHSAADGTWGAKLLYEDMDFLNQLPVMKELFSRAKIIFLRRSSKLAQAISYYIARETGKWIHSDPGRKDASEAVFNFGKIDNALTLLSRQEAKWHTFFEFLEIKPLELVYEEFTLDPKKSLREIFDFIGLTPHEFPVTTEIEQQTTMVNAQFRQRYLQEQWNKCGTLSNINYGEVEFTM